MNGAESLVRTLVNGGVEICLANPGTSEIHLVAALDKVDGMRCIPALFEAVVTGAADGYARMTGKPAATLLHQGSGLSNGLGNIHSAKKAHSPMVNIVGNHATYHIVYNTPHTADIEGIARPESHWVRTSANARSLAADGAAAIAIALSPPGQIATLIVPSDTAWEEGDGPAAVPKVPAPEKVSATNLANAAKVLRSSEQVLLLMTGTAIHEYGLTLAGRIAAATGAKLMAEGKNARLQRGAGRVAINQIPYNVDQAIAALKSFHHVILVGAQAPASYFAYPHKSSILTPEGCQIHRLSAPSEDSIHALEWLADEVGARAEGALLHPVPRPALPTGPLTKNSIAASLGALLPEGAIVCDESVTTGSAFFPMTAGAPPHDWLVNTGGALGSAMVLSTGAAIACPERKVVCLEGDGGGMYALQSLWTQARQRLDIITLIFANRSYNILRGELADLGVTNPGRTALDMIDIGRPDLNWTALAKAMGVDAIRVNDVDAFNKAFARSIATPGPYLIEVIL